jgi:hypothetical protein
MKWKKTRRISARVIEISPKRGVVLLDCLIDNCNNKNIYENKWFNIQLFDGINIHEGCYIFLEYYIRKNEERLKVSDGSGLIAWGNYKIQKKFLL